MPYWMVHTQYKKLNSWTFFIGQSYNLIHIMAEKSKVRWAFNASSWNPQWNEILAVSSYIQPEEKERISRFLFQNDAKSSLVGRLLMRKFVHQSMSIPYDEVIFGRDHLGKPFLKSAGDVSITFNVSHQGDYVVLAGDIEKNIGVDVMKIEPPANKNIPEFFRLMSRQLSNLEWETVRKFDTEMEQIRCFYRIWCLKESYVKNLGIGLRIPLQDISFSIKTNDLKVGQITTDTKLYQENILQESWLFEETLVDDIHAVAVSLQIDKNSKYTPVPFTYLNFKELVEEAKPLYEPDESFASQFINKEVKNF